MAWAIPAAAVLTSILASSVGRKSSTWSGEKQKLHKLPTFTKSQQKLIDNVFKHPDQLGMAQDQPVYQQGSDYLSRILSQDPEMMKQFEAPMMSQFNEQIMPQLSHMFSSINGQDSSGFNQAMAHEAGNLSDRIAAMRAQLGMDAANQGFSYSQLPFSQNMQKLSVGLLPRFGFQATGGTPGMGSGIASGLAQGGANALSLYGMMNGGSGGGSRGSTSWGSGFPGSSNASNSWGSGYLPGVR